MKSASYVMIFVLLSSEGLCRIYENHNLKVEFDYVTTGNSTSMYCELPAQQESITKCEISTPSGQTWEVVGGQVLDENGTPVPGYSAVDNGNPSKVCGVGIESLADFDKGDWQCLITRQNGASEGLRGWMNLRSGGLVPDVRVPRNSIPSHCTLDLISFLEPDFLTTGNFSIDLVVTLDGRNDGVLTLSYRHLSIQEQTIQLLANGLSELEILEHGYDFERDFYKITYDPSFLGTKFNLSVSGGFDGVIQDGQLGYYYDTYIDRGTGSTVYVGATQFQSAQARWAFPCIDEPDLKATFDLRMGRDTSRISLTNMPMLQTNDPIDGYPGYVWDTFETSAKQPTYLVTWAVGIFSSVTAQPTPNNVLFKIYGRPDAVADGLLDYGGAVGSTILQYYGDLLGIPFPLPKQDQIGFTSKTAPMENWGLLTYGEDGLFIDTAQASSYSQEALVTFNGHELAHQWFGDLVTTKWWDDIWLNEGIAFYFQNWGGDAAEGSMRFWDRYYVTTMSFIMGIDSRPESRPLLGNTVDHAIEAHFGRITYNKGSCMMKIMESILSLPTLISGLNDYLREYSYSNAVTDNLWTFLTEAGHRDGTLSPQYSLKSIMDPWMRYKNYPLLTVTRDYQSGGMSLSQDRFTLTPDPVDPENYQWDIPLTFTVFQNGSGNFDNLKSNTFLPRSSVLNFQIGINEDPIFFNMKSTGYYRVNYDAENWNRISAALMSDQYEGIDPINRASVLGDSFFLALSGIESFALPRQMASYLSKETEYVPLSTAGSIYNQLMSDTNLDPDALELGNNIEQVMLNWYSNNNGINAIQEATHWDNFLQTEFVDILCKFDIEPCVSDAVNVFNEWKNDPSTNPINYQVRITVYCTAIRKGDETDRAFLESQLALTFNPQERSYITSGLECNQDFAVDAVGVYRGIKERKIHKRLSRNL